MRKLNEQFDEYRDCLRLIWNLCLRHRSMGSVSFPDVSKTLLGALVLDELVGANGKNTTTNDEGYYEGLGVVVSAYSPEIYVADWGSPVVEWKRFEPKGVSPRDLIIGYADVWDFRDADKERDFEYIKGYLIGPMEVMPGARCVAIRRSHVDIVDLTAVEDIYAASQ